MSTIGTSLNNRPPELSKQQIGAELRAEYGKEAGRERAMQEIDRLAPRASLSTSHIADLKVELARELDQAAKQLRQERPEQPHTISFVAALGTALEMYPNLPEQIKGKLIGSSVKGFIAACGSWRPNPESIVSSFIESKQGKQFHVQGYFEQKAG